MKLSSALTLGRVSNLPTVWSNCLAGSLLASSQLSLPILGVTLLALSLMYLGGMFLNDAFDADWDAKFKPERPLAAGDVGLRQVWVTGITLLTLGPLLILALRFATESQGNDLALASAALLAAAILAYDWLHKRASYSPWIMGTCRLLVYTTAGLAMGMLTPLLLLAGLSLMAYIVGLTYAARSEHLNNPGSWWPLLLLSAPVLFALYLLPQNPVSAVFLGLLLLWLLSNLRALLPGPRRNVPTAVGGLLAGIPLVDASVLAGCGYWLAAGLALSAFVATILLQRVIAGT